MRKGKLFVQNYAEDPIDNWVEFGIAQQVLEYGPVGQFGLGKEGRHSVAPYVMCAKLLNTSLGYAGKLG